MTFVPYRTISALAGSGKTYQLTSRYIALLARGEDPSRILAITFTRKAAGEIFDRIVRRLAAAALSPTGCDELRRSLAEQLGEDAPAVTQESVSEWLRRFVQQMSRLRIGTIDSLFGSMVKAFAVELGLPPRMDVLDGPALDQSRDEVIGQAFRQAGRDEEGRQAFFEAFRLITREETGRVRETILDIVSEGHKLRLDVADNLAWGDIRRIWPEQPAWEREGWEATDNWTGSVARLRDHWVPTLPDGVQKKWVEWLEFIAQCQWDKAIETTASDKIRAFGPALANGGTLKYSGTYTVDTATGRALRSLYALSVLKWVERQLGMVRGMRSILDAYESVYQTHMRARGRLSFEDVPHVLDRLGDDEDRLEMEYRLDGRIDHWLIDEFQDTNPAQWRVIGRLADEVLQSGEADRSFFYVGDVKQAIYGWRGGEARLFDAVRTYYEARFGEAVSLDTSFRSSPVVLKAVNQVFSRLEKVEMLLKRYPDATKRWMKHWRHHQSAPRNTDLTGRVEIHEVEEGSDGMSGVIPLTCAMTKDLLDRGAKSIGILVRKNRFGDEITDALRQMGIPARREANPLLGSHDAIAILLAALRMIDHPADELAMPHVRRSPLWPVLLVWAGVDEGSDAHVYVARHLRMTYASNGAAGLLGEVVKHVEQQGLPLNELTRLRMRQLIDAAAGFDRQGGGSISTFAEQAAALQASDLASDGRVVVMTVYKAKGLEFDAVILPDVDSHGGSMDEASTGTLCLGHTAHAEDPANPASPLDPETAWVFPVPKIALREADPVLASFAERLRERRYEEGLCLLYVSMTRARQGLYIVTEPAPKTKEESLRPVRILRDTLCADGAAPVAYYGGIPSSRLYADGDEHWPASASATPAAAEVGRSVIVPKPVSPLASGQKPTLRRLMYRTPARVAGAAQRMVKDAFSAREKSATERGLVLHDVLSRIEWSTDGAASLPAEVTSGLDNAALNLLQRAWSAPAIRTLFQRPAGETEVWREQAFEWAHEGTWMSGRIDRVVIYRNAAGEAIRAEVIDFKSDRISDGNDLDEAVQRHAEQLNAYRNAVSSLLGLSRDRVIGRLVFLSVGQVREVGCAA